MRDPIRGRTNRFNWATPRTGWKGRRRGCGRKRESGFNWATPRTGWKANFNHVTSGGVTRFNWATPRTGWKGRVRRVGRGCRRQASIGPPRERGGKRLLMSLLRFRFEGLQLGHPANGVESERRSSRRRYDRSRFNWATPRTGWKGRCTHSSSSVTLCFNWATPRTGWKAWLPLAWPTSRARRFNWATPRTGWKVLAL